MLIYSVVVYFPTSLLFLNRLTKALADMKSCFNLPRDYTYRHDCAFSSSVLWEILMISSPMYPSNSQSFSSFPLFRDALSSAPARRLRRRKSSDRWRLNTTFTWILEVIWCYLADANDSKHECFISNCGSTCGRYLNLLSRWPFCFQPINCSHIKIPATACPRNEGVVFRIQNACCLAIRTWCGGS